MPNFLLKKQLNLPTQSQGLGVAKRQNRRAIVAARGGGLIHGIVDYPESYGIPKPHPLRKLTLLGGHA